MIKSTVMGIGLVAAVALTANAQTYYPNYYNPGYIYTKPADAYAAVPREGGYYYTYRYYSPPYQGPPGSAAYSDPYVASRPYSDGAGPRVSDHVGY